MSVYYIGLTVLYGISLCMYVFLWRRLYHTLFAMSFIGHVLRVSGLTILLAALGDVTTGWYFVFSYPFVASVILYIVLTYIAVAYVCFAVSHFARKRKYVIVEERNTSYRM
jgi:hypothetical protein